MALVGCLLAACIIGRVDAYAGSTVEPQRIHQVAPADTRLWNDLAFQEGAGQVRNALKLSGFNVPPDVQTVPEVLVLTEFGVGEPRKEVSTRRETVYDWVEKKEIVGVKPAFGGPKGQMEAVTRTTNEFKPVGERAVTETTTTYVRHITFEAYDFRAMKEKNEFRQLWKVTVVSEGESDDIRGLLPAMIAVAQPYFGKSTGKQITVKVPVRSPEAEAVRTGQPPPPKKKR